MDMVDENEPKVLEEPVLKSIAKAHKKTTAQVNTVHTVRFHFFFLIFRSHYSVPFYRAFGSESI